MLDQIMLTFRSQFKSFYTPKVYTSSVLLFKYAEKREITRPTGRPAKGETPFVSNGFFPDFCWSQNYGKKSWNKK